MKYQIQEDPNISKLAKVYAHKMWTEIEDMCIAEQDFYTAREIVLVKHIPDMRKRFGKETARRAELAIMTRPLESMDNRVLRAFEDRLRIWATKIWGRLRKRDRFCIHFFCCLWSIPEAQKTKLYPMI